MATEKISGYALKISGILPANVNDITGMQKAADGLDAIKAALAGAGVRDVKIEAAYRQRAKLKDEDVATNSLRSQRHAAE